MKARDARIVLTGATGGIGAAAAARLAAAGASLLLTGRNPARLAALAASLPAAPGATIGWHAADLAEADADAALAFRANVLIHAAGLPAFGRLADSPPAAPEVVLQLNLLAPIRLSRALLPGFAAQPKAQLIFVGSVLGSLGLPGYSLYCASKFGLRGFAEALRRELAGGPVRVQYLGPRATRTAFNSAAVEAYNRATGSRVDAPAVVAHALLRLLQDERAERLLGFPEALVARLNGLVPAWLDGAFARHRRQLAAPTAEQRIEPVIGRR
jgi:short-subunit dehydrogenase